MFWLGNLIAIAIALGHPLSIVGQVSASFQSVPLFWLIYELNK
jgi:hypothetical protein